MSPIIGWIAFGTLILLSGCKTYEGRLEGNIESSGIEILGCSVWSSEKRQLTDEEYDEKLRRQFREDELKTELEALKKERLYKIESKEKQRRVLLVMAYASYALALLSVVAGVVLKGYKTFAVLLSAFMVIGTVFLSLATTIHIFTWLLIGGVVVAVVRVMYLLKHRGYDHEQDKDKRYSSDGQDLP